MFITHFGVKVKKKIDGLNLTADNYIRETNKSSLVKGRIYSDLEVEKFKERALFNYDLNMSYFHSIEKETFKKAVNDFLTQSHFNEIHDLIPYKEVSGYYMMILDNYSSAYIGTSGDIKNRIQSHWSRQKELDRLIFGNEYNSILSIDSFRALDTTRIFVFATDCTIRDEDSYINMFNPNFLLNRTKGGNLEGLIEAIANRKTREL